MSAPGEKRLSLATILTFSLANMPVAALGVVLFVYLPSYYAGHLGLSLSVIGGAWFAVRIVDLFIDPLLGHWMDRTTTPFGRYRVWLTAGAPIFMISTYMLFLARPGVGGLYLFAWLFILYIGNSMLYLAQQAWSATLATSYNERSRVFGFTIAVGVVATVASLLIPIFAPYAGLSNNGGVQAMGWVIVAMVPLGVGFAVWRTPERLNRSDGQHFSAQDYWDIATKPEVIRLFLAQVALTLGPGWMSAMYLFYFRDVKGFPQQQATILLLVYILIGIVGAPFTARLSGRIGKHRTLMVTTVAFSVALLAVPLIPRGNVVAGAPLMAWCGFMAAGFGLTISAMMADVGDEIRLQQGRERISLLYSVLSLAGKLTSAFAIGLSLPLLELFGYVAKDGAHNTPSAVLALEWIFITGPILFVMLGGFCVWGWKLDAARHAGIRAQLDARDALEGHALAATVLPGAPPSIVVTAEVTPVATETL